MDKIDLLLGTFPLYSEDLGIDITEPSGRFKWFLAAILFGARISENIAANTYRLFDQYDVSTPEKIRAAGWDDLVKILDEGGYVRYDFSTATKLLDIVRTLTEEYGSLENLYQQRKSGNFIALNIRTNNSFALLNSRKDHINFLIPKSQWEQIILILDSS